jgi:dipeptidyl aminopeptidase/acylaminoacyl peptidase
MKIKITLLVFLSLVFLATAQENLTYQKPSRTILDLVDYQRAPTVAMDTKKEYLLLSYRDTYKTLVDLNQEELRLGGLRINPVTNISSTVTYSDNLKIRKIKDKNEIQVIGLPVNPRISNLSWSPNEKKIAFSHTTPTGVELWVLDVVTAKATKLTEASVNANFGNPFNWLNDNETILVKMLPKNRVALLDSKKDLPAGPIVSNADGSKSPNRTYTDMLKNKNDEINFENIITSELYKINTNGTALLFKTADTYIGESFSPDGNYLMLTTLLKPYSYIVPLSRFPSKTIVYDSKAGAAVKTVNELPLNEVKPKGFMAVRKGKREMEWRNDKPATLYFVEALDEGNPENKVAFRDEISQWDAPFATAPTLIAKIEQRFQGIVWGNETTAILTDEWYDTRNVRTFLINPSITNEKLQVISNRNSQDMYADPGYFETTKNQFGKQVLVLDNNDAFLIGEGFTKKGQFPFIDAFDIKTLKTKRIYQSAFTDKMESILSVEDSKKGLILVKIQSKREYPNYYFRNIKQGNKLTPITAFQNPFESIKSVYKEVINYQRKDGVSLSGTLYLPVGYDRVKKEKVPLLIWAYPSEYKDKNSAGQSNLNSNEFTFPTYGSFVYWVTKGYAVLDDASFPIIGEGTTEPNDNFLTQLVDNAEAAINAVDALGYINKKKVAVGGHSYGAFMTANLLTHSKLFACGIARSGAYNRTLTPFGFQSEQRNYWEVPEVYNTMSPFMNADKMKTPLLLVHGEADNNPGTFTLQTERYFQALKGLGATARMVILPKESHGYVAKENILHLLWEEDQFLEKYLKN